MGGQENCEGVSPVFEGGRESGGVVCAHLVTGGAGGAGASYRVLKCSPFFRVRCARCAQDLNEVCRDPV